MVRSRPRGFAHGNTGWSARSRADRVPALAESVRGRHAVVVAGRPASAAEISLSRRLPLVSRALGSIAFLGAVFFIALRRWRTFRGVGFALLLCRLTGPTTGLLIFH